MKVQTLSFGYQFDYRRLKASVNKLLSNKLVDIRTCEVSICKIGG